MPIEVNELLAQGRCFRCLDDLALQRKIAALLCLIHGGDCNAANLLSEAKCFQCLSPRQLELVIAQLICNWIGAGPCDVAEVANDTPLLNYSSWKDLYIIQAQILCDFWGGDCDDIAAIENNFCCITSKKLLRIIIAQLLCDIGDDPPVPGQVSAGLDQSICTDAGTVQLLGAANGTTGWQWTTSGDGTFNDDTILNAVYTPGPNDLTALTVTLTLTSSSPPSSDDMVITFFEAATVNVGPDLETEGIRPIQLEAVIGGSATGGTWTTSGTGTFDNATALDAIYTPSLAEAIAGGDVTLTFTTNDPDGPCGPASDSLTLTVVPVCNIEDPFIYYLNDEPADNEFRNDSGVNGYHIEKIEVVDGNITAPAGKLGEAAVGFSNVINGTRLQYDNDLAAEIGGPNVNGISLGFEDTNPPNPDEWETTICFWFKIGDPFGPAEGGNQTLFARFGNIGAGPAGYARFTCFYSRGVGFHRFALRYWRQDEVAFQDIPYNLDGGSGRLSDVVADTWYFAAVRRRNSDGQATFFIGDVATMALSSESIGTSIHPRYSVTEHVPFCFATFLPSVIDGSGNNNPLSDGSAIDEWSFWKLRALTDEEIECLFNEGAGRRPLGLKYWLPLPVISSDNPTAPAEITITVPQHPSATIYYTLNGDTPDENSTLYEGPFQLDDGATIKAIAFETGWEASYVRTLVVGSSLYADLDWFYPLLEQSGSFLTIENDLPLARNGVTYDANSAASEFERSDPDFAGPLTDTRFQLSSDFTLSVEFMLESKPSGGNNQQIIFAKASVGTNSYVLFYHTPTDRLYFLIKPSSGGDIQLTFSTAGALSLNTWYFAIMRRSGTTLAVSINDGTKDTTAMANAPHASATPFEIGRYLGADHADARIRNVAKWNNDLSNAQITTLYQQGLLGQQYGLLTNTKFAGEFTPVATTYWQNFVYSTEQYQQFEHALKNTATRLVGGGFDTSDCAHFTRASSQYSYYDAQRFAFNPTELGNTAEFTMLMRVRLDSKPGDMVIFSRGGSALDPFDIGDPEFRLFYDSGSDRFAFTLWDNTGVPTTVTDATLGSPAINTWYRVFVYRSGTVLAIKIDAGGPTSTAFAGTIQPAEQSHLLIGRGPAGDYFDGRMNTFRKWNRRLTDNEMNFMTA